MRTASEVKKKGGGWGREWGCWDAGSIQLCGRALAQHTGGQVQSLILQTKKDSSSNLNSGIHMKTEMPIGNGKQQHKVYFELFKTYLIKKRKKPKLLF